MSKLENYLMNEWIIRDRSYLPEIKFSERKKREKKQYYEKYSVWIDIIL